MSDPLPEYSERPDGWFTCSWCGRHYEPDPDMVCEAGLEPLRVGIDISEEEAAEFMENNPSLESLKDLTDDELKARGLTRDAVEKMLRGEPVHGLSDIVCRECQDKGLEQQDTAP